MGSSSQLSKSPLPKAKPQPNLCCGTQEYWQGSTLRMLKINLTLTLVLLCFTSSTHGQNSRSIYACGYDENHVASEMCTHLQNMGVGFSDSHRKSTKAEQLVASILEPIGLPQTFVVSECDDIQNAIATTYEGERYIIFDPDFVNGYAHDYGDGLWMKKAILAHEIGHHLCGHTLRGNKTLLQQRNMELEADEFAGFMLSKLGASQREALLAVNLYGSNGDDRDSTHPNKEKRTRAVLNGYRRAQSQIKSTPQPSPNETSTIVVASYDKAASLYETGDYRTASAMFYALWLESKQNGNEDFSLIYNSALSSENAGDYALAAERFEYLSERFNSFNETEKKEYEECAVFAALDYQQADMFKEAKEVLQNARYIQPSSTAILFELLNLHILDEEDDYIIQIASAILDLDPLNETVIFLAAYSFGNMGKLQEERELYEILLAIDDQNYDAIFNLGASYFNQGVDSSTDDLAMEYFLLALTYYEQAFMLNPDDTDLYQPMRDAYYHTGQSQLGDEFNKLIGE